MTDALIAIAKAPTIAYNEKDWDRLTEILGANFLYEEMATHRRLDSLDEAIAAWKGWAKAFPDSKAEFGDVHVAGNTVVLEVTWVGTHTGPMDSPNGEIPPTNKSISMPAALITKVEDGKVVSQRQYFDLATMFQQLGLSG